jgi:outer membrane protein TolC
VTGVLALLLMAGVSAQGAALTEEDAVALALRNSPQVKSRDHFVDEATALTDAGLAWNNPHLRISGLRYDELVEPLVDRRSYGTHPLYHASMALRWSPPGLGERYARKAEGLAREADARMELAVARRDTAALVRTQHAQILNYDAQIALARDIVEQRAKLRILVKKRLEQQMGSLFDQNLIDVDYLDAQTELAEMEMRRRAVYDELLIQLGLPAGEVVQLSGKVDSGCTPPDEASKLVERAHAANPRLHVIEAQENAVEAEQTRRGMELVPWVDYLQLGYGFAGDNNPSYIAFQFQLTLPLFDWKRPHRRALAARHQALTERLHAEERVLSDLVLRSVAAQTAQSALVLRYQEAASIVEGGLARLREAVEQGRVTNLFELVQLQTRLLATKRSYLRAHLECKLQKIELDRLTSADLEK